MAKVSLRGYNRDIGTLIDQGQLEEAVGHCNHILKTFPKHLETYQLLGKAYLEAKRYKDASDVFTRLLAAIPNDFVAHVGMSMIGDETNNLDDAIWHMERAFEAQPSNTAVQSELQRLYGRRDGVQPPKIRMTSGALANVYMQGELYPQAIAELMSVEAKEPGRMDIQTLLAMAYLRSGQKVEASKVASDILAKSPYNLDANRILVTILPETSRAESTQVYRHRINALDPYAAFAKKSIFDTSDVADAAVNLERLDWQPGDTVFDDDGSWSDASIQADKKSDTEPEWLKNASNMDIDLTPPEEAPAEPADNIPDFMRAAGWGESSGAAEEPTSFFDSPDSAEENADDTPIAQAELPDWMKNIAPDQAELEAAAEETSEMDDAMADDFINDLLGNDDDENDEGASGLGDLGDLGDLGTSSEEQDAAMNWLESLAANQGANPEELITDSNARTENAPDWVQQATGTSQAANTPPAETPPTQPEDEDEDDDMAWLNELGDEDTSPASIPEISGDDDTPDWLSDFGADETTPTEAATETGDVPDWLNQLGNEESESAELNTENKENLPDWLNETEESADEPGENADDDDDDMAWLNELGGDDLERTPEEPVTLEAPPSAETESVGAVADDMIGTLGTSGEDQDAAMNWLESLAANQGANPEELITDPSARTEAAPEWVEQAKTASESAPVADTPSQAPEASDEFTEPSSEDDDDMAWLNELAGDNAAPITEEPEMFETPTPPAETESVGAVADDTIGTLGTSGEDQDAAMNWLESLAANQGANPEELITDPSARTEAAPEWVEQAKTASESAPAPKVFDEEKIEAEETASVDDEMDETLDWLQETQETTPVASVVETPIIEEEDVPEWLREDTADDGDDDMPAWLQDTEETPVTSMSMDDAPTLETAPPPVVEDDFTAPEVEDAEEKTLAEQAEARLAHDAPDPLPLPSRTPEIPVEPPVEEASTPVPPPAEEEKEDLPSWLADMGNEEKVASVTADDDLPDWLQEESTEKEPTPVAEPTKAEEWKPVAEEAASVALPEEKPAVPPVPEKEPEPVATELPPRRKVKRMNTTMLRDITLMSAQAAMREGNITAALAEYGKLIKKKRLLDETIYDLREALYDYPVDVSIWQMLGDAYMRAGQLQEAINAYTKAEELLR